MAEFNGTNGPDTFNGTSEGDVILGNGGNDNLSGHDGDDTIDGGEGNDGISGGNGNDTITDNAGINSLIGGAGSDTINSSGSTNANLASHNYSTYNHDIFAEVDVLIGGNGDEGFFAGFNDTVSGGGGSNYLDLNLTGSTSGMSINLDTLFSGGSITNGLGTISGINNGATITGSGFDDLLGFLTAGTPSSQAITLDGKGGNDQLNGGLGNDSLYGGAGIDILQGGEGNDLLTSDYFEAAGAGRDTGLEQDELFGGSGNDTFDAGLGDIVVGGDGNDSVSLNLAAATSGVALSISALASNSGVALFGGNVSQIEGIFALILPNFANDISLAGQSFNTDALIIGGTVADIMVGSGFRDQLNGGDGDDRLEGRGGNDYLSGGAGNDFLLGGADRDTIDGGTGIDTVSYADAASSMTIFLSPGNATDGANNFDQLYSIEHAIGSDFDDRIVGTAAANTLTGGLGNDRLEGGFGDDLLEGGDGNDILDGGAGSNLLVGGAGDDRLVLSGNGGASVSGGGGFDTLVITTNAGFYDQGASIEAVELANGATLFVSSQQLLAELPLTASFTGIGNVTVEMIPGAAFLSKLFGVSAGVTFTVNGTEGTDVFKLGNANHTINAGDGLDQIKGGTGNDTINGGDGIDKISGGGGIDILTGGAGNDVFRYLNSGDSGVEGNSDQITDFAIGEDRLNFVKIDADANSAGDQAFTFLGVSAFTGGGTGQIRFEDSGADLLVLVDVDGNGTADMEVILQGLAGQTLSGTDFAL